VIDALRSVVAAPAGFFFFGKEDSRAYAEGTRLVDAAPKHLKVDSKTLLSSAFGYDLKSVVSTTRRAYADSELYPQTERLGLSYYRDHSVSDGLTHAALLFLHEGGILFGLAGLERRTSEPDFSIDELQTLEALAPFIVAGARSHLQYDELAKEASALRALSRGHGTLVVIDRDKKKVVWAADREHGIDWDHDIVPIGDLLTSAAEDSLAARARGEALPTPPRLSLGTVTGVAKIDGDPVFGAARCAVIRVEHPQPQKPQAMDGLSRREREIARLLVAGYSGVNVAAISGLSENTVRTYVRRLYAKLGVANRADLVRKLITPEPTSVHPPSVLRPPPDSSLAISDDTLD
jgi:DNA-binding CsgD family transcriptional regulator